ncbi:uncharacterized protein RCO7_04183 [Rhynchosporium graminicola]|uniref:Uncharacterized protein n=1 Tax=Rhynchosporium graminicola TaxID=2792576 RepID=A0A1E1KK79_9HELO|nr:uncharacterized protein RCO7_04183 [Rhynchosporium commune]
MAPAELSIHTDPSTRSRRSQSISSDRPSLGGFGGLLSPPSNISPDPAFIAASAASQIVTNDHDSHADTWLDQHGIEPSGETALVAPPALKLVNKFLDQLLFNFLSISRSTSLASLRPAVAEVLKPKLAKEAIAGADQELHEYLGGGEEEELLAFSSGLEPSGDTDLELIWKRTRLRCMVYSSLGDMEEEDEDFYTESQQLDGPLGPNNRFSNSSEVVSPAVAIFLTSILEFMGEQVLVVAGQAAYYRLKLKIEKEDRDGTQTPADIAERVVVEDSDMERVALDRTLGRLWRGWKKRIRSTTTSSVSSSYSFSRDSSRSQTRTRAASVGPEEVIHEDRRPSLAAVLAEHEYAASIPLPINTNDIEEIEIPGLAYQSDDEDEDTSDTDEEIRVIARPKSMMIFTGSSPRNSLYSSQIEHPKSLGPRKRSNSVPSSAPLPFKPSKRQKSSVEKSEQPVVQSENEVLGGDELTEAKDEAAAQKEDAEQEKSSMTEPKGSNATIFTLGAAAVAGLVAAAKGEAPQTAIDDAEEPETEKYFTEEPQIMTSSRVSVGGRISPDEYKAGSSRGSSPRSPSVHSLRLVDITAPKSPARSREGSFSAADFGRPVVVSIPNSTYSPCQTSRMTSPISRGSTASPIERHGSSHSVRRTRNSAGDSISEIDEQNIDLATSMSVPVEAANLHDERPQPAAFVLNTATFTRHPQGLSISTRVEKPVSTKSAVDPTTAAGKRGAPPLSPLREMMDGAQGTSDEYSSNPPSIDTRSVTDNTSSLPSVEPQYQTRVDSRSSPPRLTAPEHNSKSQHLNHTSGSGSSSSSHKMKPIRTSEDSGSRNVDRKGQSFEQLIRSDQTIQYTLTPQNIRDIEAPDSPRYPTPPIIPDARPMTGRSNSSSVSRINGLNSNPPIEVARSIKSAKSFKAASKPQASNPGTRLRPNAPEARDARIDRDSIGDFAEFIRSTGPANAYETAPTIPASTNRGPTGAPQHLNPAGPPHTGTTTSMPKRSTSSAGRNRLQARDAVVPRGNSVSDLIDFVRSGPQLEKQDHRIPRTVAPFRSTMDSDQMNGAVGGRAVDATIPDVRFSNTASVTSSITSQSALLNGSRNKALPAQGLNGFEEEEMMPKRKTRRVRDPYAIDFSDEEDDDLLPSRPPPIKEESLAEFLKNTAPPPSPPESVRAHPSPEIVTSKKMKKKASSGSLMSRFGRSGSISSSAPPVPSMPQSMENSGSPQEARKTPHYAPIKAKYNTSTSKNEQTRNDNYVSQLDSARNNDAGRRKVVQKSYQPREAVYASSPTNDLADFLRSSEPPSSMQTQPQTFAPVLQKDEANAFQRMFGRKKAR